MKASVCSSTGARAGAEHWLAGNIPGWTSESLTNALYQSRYLSNEGRLFFDSADALVPGIATPTREEQVNGHTQKVGVENVYEYEPAGVGSCASGAAGGCVATDLLGHLTERIGVPGSEPERRRRVLPHRCATVAPGHR